MIIRPATLSDKSAIFRIAMEETKRYPHLKPEPDKIKALIVDAISAAKHFCMVAESGGGIKAVLIGLAGDNMWAQRQFCSIVLWVSKLPGAGRALMHEFKAWLMSRPVIRVAGFAIDSDVDPRALALMERYGFKKNGGSMLWYRMEAVNGTV